MIDYPKRLGKLDASNIFAIRVSRGEPHNECGDYPYTLDILNRFNRKVFVVTGILHEGESCNVEDFTLMDETRQYDFSGGDLNSDNIAVIKIFHCSSCFNSHVIVDMRA